jgi:hypothetical protein
VAFPAELQSGAGMEPLYSGNRPATTVPAPFELILRLPPNCRMRSFSRFKAELRNHLPIEPTAQAFACARRISPAVSGCFQEKILR